MKKAHIVVGLGYGDEGKGTIVDFLTRHHKSALTVRFNGGPQCGHQVVDDYGRSHIFSHFGSGMLAGASTLIGPKVLINPLTMESEEKQLRSIGVTDAWARTYIHAECVVITPYHRALNRLTEMARGKFRHGSCGMGIGACVEFGQKHPNLIIRAADLRKVELMMKQLSAQRDAVWDMVHKLPAQALEMPEMPMWLEELSTFDYPVDTLAARYANWFFNGVTVLLPLEFAQILNAHEHVVFEGAQGVLLDEHIGFHPYTTWSRTTTDYAHEIIACYGEDIMAETIGVTRVYATRHGAGPFPSESPSPYLSEAVKDDHNHFNEWQGNFRKGWLDLVSMRYARQAIGRLDYVAVTHMDKLASQSLWPVVTEYPWEDFTPHDNLLLEDQEVLTRRLMGIKAGTRLLESGAIVNFIANRLCAPVLLESHGKTSSQKRILTPA